jgi:hypothetical protein
VLCGSAHTDSELHWCQSTGAQAEGVVLHAEAEPAAAVAHKRDVTSYFPSCLRSTQTPHRPRACCLLSGSTGVFMISRCCRAHVKRTVPEHMVLRISGVSVLVGFFVGN